jgi:hypothetical protein
MFIFNLYAVRATTVQILSAFQLAEFVTATMEDARQVAGVAQSFQIMDLPTAWSYSKRRKQTPERTTWNPLVV